MSFENDIVVLRRVYDTFSNLLINDGFRIGRKLYTINRNKNI